MFDRRRLFTLLAGLGLISELPSASAKAKEDLGVTFQLQREWKNSITLKATSCLEVFPEGGYGPTDVGILGCMLIELAKDQGEWGKAQEQKLREVLGLMNFEEVHQMLLDSEAFASYPGKSFG